MSAISVAQARIASQSRTSAAGIWLNGNESFRGSTAPPKSAVANGVKRKLAEGMAELLLRAGAMLRHLVDRARARTPRPAGRRGRLRSAARTRARSGASGRRRCRRRGRRRRTPRCPRPRRPRERRRGRSATRRTCAIDSATSGSSRTSMRARRESLHALKCSGRLQRAASGPARRTAPRTRGPPTSRGAGAGSTATRPRPRRAPATAARPRRRRARRSRARASTAARSAAAAGETSPARGGR